MVWMHILEVLLKWLRVLVKRNEKNRVQRRLLERLEDQGRIQEVEYEVDEENEVDVKDSKSNIIGNPMVI